MLGKKGGFDRLLASLLVISLSPLIFVGIPTRIAFNEWFIDWEYSKADFPQDRYGMDEDYRRYLAKLGLKAVLSNEGMEEFKRARLPDGRPAFTPREIKHMEDVKNFLGWFFPLLYLSALFSFLSLLYLRDGKLIGWTLLISSLFSLTLILGVALLSITNYDLAFELFHNYVFDPYSWRFRYTDTLLRIYPMKFWYDGTLLVISMSLLFALISFISGVLLIRYRRWS